MHCLLQAGEEKPEDTALGLKSFTAYIDSFSEAFLDDAVVDYATDRMGGQLTIKAPNAKVPMVNADSPVNERINYYLQTEINPGLASHGGQVSLIDVVEDGIAVLEFGGGCQGCGQADVTLKEGIERTLLERIPELKGVRDVTRPHAERKRLLLIVAIPSCDQFVTCGSELVGARLARDANTLV